LWLGIGLAVVVAALAIVESREPYYFCQDDVLASAMPTTLYACRSVWQGVLPEYNPYVMMGVPLLEVGGMTYPPTYLAYAVARHVLGNEFLTAEVYAAMHLLAGYVVTYLVARRLGLRGAIACLVALSFVLSGAMLIMGRSWNLFLVAAVFQPLLILAADRLRVGPVGWRWTAATGLAAGLYYHGTFPMLWFCGMFFFTLHLACLWAWRTIPLGRLVWALPAGLLAGGLIFPVFFQQFLLSRNMAPYGGESTGVGNHFAAFLLPYPLCQAALPKHWGSRDCQYGGHFCYFGTVLTVLFLAALGDWLVAVLRRRRPQGIHIWTCLAAVAFVLCLGDDGLSFIWRLIAKLPAGLNNHPFRVMPIFVLYSSLAGGLLLERLSRILPWGNRLATAVVCLGCLLLVYHAGCARTAFYTYGFRPFPALPGPLAALLESPSPATVARSVSCAPQRSVDPTYAFCLPHNLPTFYQLPALSGYDTICLLKPPYRHVMERIHIDMFSALRAYGVRWCLIHRTCRQNTLSAGLSRDLERTVLFEPPERALRGVRYHDLQGLDDVLQVAEIEGAAPLCFRLGRPQRALPIRLDGRGIHVELDPTTADDPVVVNFLHYPELHAFVDGQFTPITVDAWGRMQIPVAAGNRSLEVRYCPPWSQGLLLGAAMVLGGVLIMLWLESAMRAQRLTCPKPAAAA
jgi:hypothetical protein